MTEPSEVEALRAAILAYIDKCNDKERLAGIITICLEGKMLADLPEHLRPRFEEVSVAGVVVLAMKR